MSRKRIAGAGLLDVMMAMTFITTGFLGMASLQVNVNKSQESAAKEAMISNGVRSVVERIRATPFEDALANFQYYTFTMQNGSITEGYDWGYDPETETFDEAGVYNRAYGYVQVFTDETADWYQANQLTLPRDLNGDGVVSSYDVSSDYELLPVEVTVFHVDRSGYQNQSFYFLLSRED